MNDKFINEFLLAYQSTIIENEKYYKKIEINYKYGNGFINVYNIFDGVYIFISDCIIKEDIVFNYTQKPVGYILFNYCFEGECHVTSEYLEELRLKKDELVISNLKYFPNMQYPKKIYKGICIMMKKEMVAYNIKTVLSDVPKEIYSLVNILDKNENYYLIKNNEAVKNIFKSMKEINDKEYLAIKMLELFLFLKNYFSQYFIDEYKIMNSITDDIVKNIKDDVIKNLNKRIYIKTLSKKYGLSESTIKNKFRTIYGETLYSYIKKQKMHKASLLILSNKMKIIDIALELGYSNASKFAKAFKDIYGVTPSEYRKVN